MNQHDGSIHHLIKIISKELSASSIMTPWKDVLCVEGDSDSASTRISAISLMEEHQFSGVPVVAGGVLRGAYIRHQPDSELVYESIQVDHLVTPALSLIDLIRFMRDQKRIAVVVGGQYRPLGWLTYADFSKRPFRVLLFAIVAEMEVLLASALDETHPGDSWLELLGERGGKIENRKKEARDFDTTMPATTFADLSHLIGAVVASEKVRRYLCLQPHEIEALNNLREFRNRIAHAVKPVVQGPAKIKHVADQIDWMLKRIDWWSLGGLAQAA